MSLRRLIFETAAELEDVGLLEETLKSGQPSYLASPTKSGTTIRVDQIKSGAILYFGSLPNIFVGDVPGVLIKSFVL